MTHPTRTVRKHQRMMHADLIDQMNRFQGGNRPIPKQRKKELYSALIHADLIAELDVRLGGTGAPTGQHLAELAAELRSREGADEVIDTLAVCVRRWNKWFPAYPITAADRYRRQHQAAA